jgi:hypothetical protein
LSAYHSIEKAVWLMDSLLAGGNVSINSQPAIFNNFMPFQYYWTSTTDAADTTKAWTVFSCDFGVYDISKINTGYSLAVR